jgi:hypothetical protein
LADLVCVHKILSLPDGLHWCHGQWVLGHDIRDFHPIISAKGCGDRHVHTLQSFTILLLQRLCQKSGQIFRCRFGGFMLDCFNPFSLTRKSCGNFSQLRKKSLGTESSSEEPFDEAHDERSLARSAWQGEEFFDSIIASSIPSACCKSYFQTS